MKKIIKTNKELKDALKNEVAPLLIGLRNEIKETNKELGKLASKSVPVNELEIIFDGKKVTGIKGKDGNDGKDGYTPVKGKDYRDGKDGKNGSNGKDGYTPVYGKDFWTKAELDTFTKEIISQSTPIKGIHYRDGKDGKDGVTKTVVEYVELDGIEVRNKLEELKGRDRLSVKAIKGIDELIKSIVATASIPSGIGGSGGSSTGGTPSGSNTQVQYNNNGAFGGASIFYTGGRTGIGASATSPRGTIDIKNITNYTIGDVVSGDTDITFSYGSGNYSADGSYYEIWVYAGRTIGGNNIYSENPFIITGTDNGSFDPFVFGASFTAVTDADFYKIRIVTDTYYGASDDYYFNTTSTSFSIGGNDVGYDDISGQYYQYESPIIVTPTSASVGADVYIDETTGHFKNTDSQFYFDGTINATTFSGAFSGNGSAVTNISASNISSGTLPVGRGGTGATTLGSTQVLVGNGASAITSSSGFTFNTSTGKVTVSNGNSTSLAMEITGNNFTRFAVANTNASGSGSLYAISSFNMQTTLSYVQFAAYGNGTNNGSRWGMSLSGVAELTHVSLGGATAFVIGSYDNLPLVFGTQQAERMRITGANVVIGSTTASARLHVVATTEQLRVGYDASNYYSTTVSSNGGVTFNAVGSGSAFTFSDPVTINGTLTMSAQNIVTDTSTGMKIGTATTQKIGFYNVTPVIQPSAYTQTYSTATKTHSNLTSTDLSGITSSTTGSALAEPSVLYTQSEMQQNFRRVQDQFNLLKADLTNLKQVVNAIIDDAQALGLVG